MAPSARRRAPARRCRASRARVAAATSAWRIRLSPTRKVDDADLRQPGEVGRREDAAFADHDAVARHQRRQPLGDLERGDEGLEVAVVDADRAAICRRSARSSSASSWTSSSTSMPCAKAAASISRGGAVVERRHDDEDAVRAQRARFGHLVGVVHEVLAQHRQRGRGAGRDEMLGRALERRRRRSGPTGRRRRPPRRRAPAPADRSRRGSAPSTGSPS